MTHAQRPVPRDDIRPQKPARKGRFVLDHLEPERPTLPEDVRRGLTARPKQLPPKYFYDALGSELFDRICTTPEYYPTRTERGLLERVADQLVRSVNPTDIVELGSGAARKTQWLLDAAASASLPVRYVPFDVSESMLVESSQRLLETYPWLSIHAVAGDYTRHLEAIPPGGLRLILFLGSTIGNFEPHHAVEFLRSVRRKMRPEDRFLLGLDLVKAKSVLDAAYNDKQGLTEAFNKNVLSVINRELDATFALDRFEHVAFFSPERSQVEMHLRSRGRQSVRIEKLALTVDFEEGETILTEISRKFRKDSAKELLVQAGFELIDWHTPDNGYFALALARPCFVPV